MADIDSSKPHRTLDRAIRRMGLRNTASVHARISQFQQTFLHQRRPGRTLITTTAWPDLTLHPRDLPRVRDRLARFYRGPDELPTTLPVRQLRGPLADSLDRSRLYWVDPDFADVAEHATAQLPAVTASRDLPPCDDGLLLWSRSVTTRRITAAAWSSRDGSLQIVLYRAIGGGLDPGAVQHLRDEVGWLAPMHACHLAHDQLPDDYGSGHPAAILLATWLLIAQKAAETPPTEIDKTIRKTYARAQRPLPDVRIVRIRAHTKPDTAITGPATQARTGRPYTNRVWVTGHWRNQAYGPGRALRRPVYIHPFLRGPDDAPIILNTTVRILDSRGASKPETGATE